MNENKILIKYLDKHPQKLIDNNRWDIVIKYFYVNMFRIYKGHPPEWLNNLYKNHIMVLNGGYEEKTIYQSTGKTDTVTFLSEFIKLIRYIEENGYDSKYPVPISKTKGILNGSHRIAICASYNIPIPVNIIDTDVKLKFTSESFKNRSKHSLDMPKIDRVIKNNLDTWENDVVALNYLLDNLDTNRIIVFFNKKEYDDKHHYINDFFNANGIKVMYKKSIDLSPSGIYKFIQHLYFGEEKVNTNIKTNNTFRSSTNKNHQSLIMIINGRNDVILNMSSSGGYKKLELRNIMGNVDSIHVTDNMIDTATVGKLVFNDNSLYMINKMPINMEESLAKKIMVMRPKMMIEGVALTGSTIMEMAGIRKSLDMDTDFMYDDVNLKTQYANASHNQYIKYYPDNILNLLYNPTYHFYYLGIKCLTLDVVMQFKKNRNEVPKDIVDVNLILDFQMNDTLKESISIITPTHILPSAPNTEIIEKMLESLYGNVIGSKYVNHYVFVDSDKTNPNRKEYIANLNKLKNYYSNLYIIEVFDSGLKTNYINGLRLCKTPYVFFVEHDWVFLEKIPLKRFVDIMDKNNHVNLIKLSKRNNMEVGGWDSILEQDKDIPDLIKTNSWSNHPHVSRKRKWIDEWLAIIDPNVKAVKSYGVEDVMFNRYQEDIVKYGFSRAHLQWGCYNWKTNSGIACIKHLDGSEHYEKNTLDGRCDL